MHTLLLLDYLEYEEENRIQKYFYRKSGVLKAMFFFYNGLSVNDVTFTIFCVLRPMLPLSLEFAPGFK